MIATLSYKTNQFLVLLVKLCIVIAAFCLIINKLTAHDQLDFSSFGDHLLSNGVLTLRNLSFLLALTFLNWFFEILKWKILVSRFATITFKDAAEQSLGSFTASLITPNRIGEYGAKALYYLSAQRKKVLLLNLLGNFYQLAATILFGVWGYWVLSQQYAQFALQKPMLLLLGCCLSISIFAVISMKTKIKIKGIVLNGLLNFIQNTSILLKAKVFGIAMLRYLIFTFQFYCLLQMFGYQIGYSEVMPFIASMYLLSSVIPNIFMLDVVVKGGVAVYLFSFLGIDAMTSLSITMFMWLLNFVIPGIVGSYHVLKFDGSKIQQAA